MTSKERVMTALSNQEPDRVPINYSANGGIDSRLKEHFGLEPNDWAGLRNTLGVDFTSVGPRYTGPKLHEDDPERALLAALRIAGFACWHSRIGGGRRRY